MPERLPGFSLVRVFERCDDRVPMIFTISGLVVGCWEHFGERAVVGVYHQS
jgi:hypothetical protein